jgi:hypothetical protein
MGGWMDGWVGGWKVDADHLERLAPSRQPATHSLGPQQWGPGLRRELQLEWSLGPKPGLMWLSALGRRRRLGQRVERPGSEEMMLMLKNATAPE